MIADSHALILLAIVAAVAMRGSEVVNA